MLGTRATDEIAPTLEKDEIVSFEALVRWANPDLGLILPAQFIPVAEECGLIVPLGDWVIRTACSQAQQWQHQFNRPIRISVNVSTAQFRQKEFEAGVSRALHETGLAPQLLELEFTEALLLEDVDACARLLAELKSIGVRIIIDDFGTGYSSLTLLRRFPIDSLKIDQSFVRDIHTDRDDAVIVAATIGLGHSLNLRVIAEGVSNPEQLAFLRDNGCDECQGYLISRPQPADQIEPKASAPNDGALPAGKSESSYPLSAR